MNRHHHRLALVVPALAAVGLLILGGCSDSSSSANDSAKKVPATTAPAASGVKITSLEVPPSVDCGGKTSVDITISYAVEGAARQELYVDGRKVDGTEQPSAALTTWVHCDTLPHTVDVVGYDAKGRHTALEKMVTTNA